MMNYHIQNLIDIHLPLRQHKDVLLLDLHLQLFLSYNQSETKSYNLQLNRSNLNFRNEQVSSLVC